MHPTPDFIIIPTNYFSKFTQCTPLHSPPPPVFSFTDRFVKNKKNLYRKEIEIEQVVCCQSRCLEEKKMPPALIHK
jgi:hypothetical protein